MLSGTTITVYLAVAAIAIAALYLLVGTAKVLWLHKKRLFFGWIIFCGVLGLLKVLTMK